eukprot:Amastigsp_a343952_63.p2 type:complete len:322 gc:universal Amastigsp_a343952_63:170-1135(+)
MRLRPWTSFCSRCLSLRGTLTHACINVQARIRSCVSLKHPTALWTTAHSVVFWSLRVRAATQLQHPLLFFLPRAPPSSSPLRQVLFVACRYHGCRYLVLLHGLRIRVHRSSTTRPWPRLLAALLFQALAGQLWSPRHGRRPLCSRFESRTARRLSSNRLQGARCSRPAEVQASSTPTIQAGTLTLRVTAPRPRNSRPRRAVACASFAAVAPRASTPPTDAAPAATLSAGRTPRSSACTCSAKRRGSTRPHASPPSSSRLRCGRFLARPSARSKTKSATTNFCSGPTAPSSVARSPVSSASANRHQEAPRTTSTSPLRHPTR